MQAVQVADFEANFSEIIKNIQQKGTKYIIEYGKNQEKIAVIQPYDPSLEESKPRKFGLYKTKGSFKLNDGFKMSEEELLGYE